MNPVHRHNNVDSYLSPKRVLRLALAIVLSYYTMFTIVHFFGRWQFINSTMIEERMQRENRRVMEALRYDNVQAGENDGVPQISANPESNRDRQEPKPSYWSQLLYNIPLTFVLVVLVLFYNRKILSVKFKHLRNELAANILGSVIIAFVLSTLSTLMQVYIWPNFPGLPHSIYRFLRMGWTSDLMLTAVCMVIVYLLRSQYKEKRVAVENETLRAENLTTRYEALKNQLDPHFLFNSLNTLKSLIDVDVDKADGFVQQLSTVLRYTLKNDEVVTLAAELDCVRSYCQMMKMRYGDNLVFDHHINHEKYDQYHVLPLSIQGLIENAIKHNVISSKQPLTVHVLTDDNNHLIISNKIQPKIGKKEGTGIGLANLVERYRIKWNENVEIFDDGTNFTVTLPLKQNE